MLPKQFVTPEKKKEEENEKCQDILNLRILNTKKKKMMQQKEKSLLRLVVNLL